MRSSSFEALFKGLVVGAACAVAAACNQGDNPGKQGTDLGAVDISDYSEVVVETGFSAENAESVRSAVMTILTSRPINGYPGMLYPDLTTSPTFSLAIYGDCDQALEAVREIFVQAYRSAGKEGVEALRYECGPVTNQPRTIAL